MSTIELGLVPDIPRLCPDGGICAHDCAWRTCFRVTVDLPAPGIYPGDQWPDHVRQTFGLKEGA